MLIDIVYENGPIKFFCISAVLMLDVSIDTGLRTFLHLISIYKYSRFVVFDVFDRQGKILFIFKSFVSIQVKIWYQQCIVHGVSMEKKNVFISQALAGTHHFVHAPGM